MNSHTTYVLVAVSILAAIIAITPAYAGSFDEEACPGCNEALSADDIQNMRLADVPVRVWTDKAAYEFASDIHIQGVVSNLKPSVPVTVTVTGPQGNIIRIEQIDVAEDKTFEAVLSTTGSLWNKDGTYTIRVQYGGQETNDKVTVELTGTPIKTSTACTSDEITVKSQTDSYCIPFSSDGVAVAGGTVSSTSFSIVLMVDAENDGTLALTIPRSVLDSQTNGVDSPFIVSIDGDEGDAFEAQSDETTRTLEISVPEGSTEIEIIGTYAVPEFGTIAAIILAVAIVSIIAVSARSRLSILPRY